jgi:hypothetical protein
MANTYTWSIQRIQAKKQEGNLQNVVNRVWWMCIARNEAGISANTYSVADIPLSVDTSGFVPYDNLTEDVVLSWVKSAINVTAVQDDLDRKITELQNVNEILMPLPWGLRRGPHGRR